MFLNYDRQTKHILIRNVLLLLNVSFASATENMTRTFPSLRRNTNHAAATGAEIKEHLLLTSNWHRQQEECIDLTIDGQRWHDSDSMDYNCDWYSDTSNCEGQACCELYGNDYENEYTAKVACCVCGGGDTTKKAPQLFKPTTTTTDSCTSNTLVGGGAWHDSYGEEYTCEWYGESEDYCEKYGSGHEKDGHTANTACCECGGGNTPNQVANISDPVTCFDIKVSNGGTWHDSYGEEYTCQWYGESEDYCEKLGSGFEKEGHTANTACCVCGGGSTSKQESNVLDPVTCSDYKASNGDGWHDSFGKTYTCSWYGEKADARCENYGGGSEKYGYTANTACCVCGGGDDPVNLILPVQSDPSDSNPDSDSSQFELNDYEQEWLDEHNKQRKKFHNMYGYSFVPVEWDKTLAKSAQSYAEFLVKKAHDVNPNADNCHLYHTQDGFKGGENLAANYGDQPDSIKNALYRFTEEEHDGSKWKKGIIEKDDSNNRPAGNFNFSVHGHFSQTVWRATTKVGCGHATKPKGTCSIQVCRYSKPGNCNMCAWGACNSLNNIPAERWKQVIFADDSLCEIPQKWWENNQ